jgi:hypothetical protein
VWRLRIRTVPGAAPAINAKHCRFRAARDDRYRQDPACGMRIQMITRVAAQGLC